MSAKTLSERQRQWRDKRKKEGYQMHTIWLEPDVARGLDGLLEGSEKKQVDRQRIINEILRKSFM